MIFLKLATWKAFIEIINEDWYENVLQLLIIVKLIIVK